MRLVTFILFVLALIVGPRPAFAAGLIVTDAKIAAGSLTVRGKSPLANQTVELDGKFSVQSDATRNFTFGVPYVPADCVVQITAGASSKKAAIANCAVGQPQGVSVTGSISLSGILNGRCNQVTFGVAGAKVGDSVIVSTGAAIQNGIVFHPARVASDGHVEVNACNFTGGSMTAINNFPVKIITFP